jgi:hypothetical protein
VSKAIAAGPDHRALGPHSDDVNAPIPSPAAHRRVHHHLVREKSARRSAWSSRPATPARCTTWRCSSATAPARSTPTWPSSRIEDMIAATCSAGGIAREGGQELHQGRWQGRAEGDVQDGRLDGRQPTPARRSSRPSARSQTWSTSTSPAPRQARVASGSTRSPPRRWRCATRRRTRRRPEHRSRTASSSWAASTSGAARASRTCSTRRRCSSCSTHAQPSATTSSSSTPPSSTSSPSGCDPARPVRASRTPNRS